ncbi:beta-lactamase/transpeptidase-like protein [Auriscalpium vulgare]|uniref:Beta-lactamase/transpeptidase-like protein n=1 Tax=Auriscalpium vulgare TaxID=40419 RepID=A0ACB8RGF7_9AGAM|nr:beta-lactamase/transpeptidase-like protein [Auriscalpium vulgare]
MKAFATIALVWLLALVCEAVDLSAADHRQLQQPLAQAIFTPGLVKAIQRVLDAHDVPGLSVGVVRSDGVAEYGGWGVRSEDGDGMTSDTLFDVGSCSKAFLAAAVGILIDDYAHGRNSTPLPASLEKLDWDTKLKDLLPGEWELMDHWAHEKADIVDILTHVSGLPRHDFAYSSSDTPASMTRRLRFLRPAFELRQQWSYNNIMFMVGAHIITTYAGSYTEFVEDRIFKPLGMRSTTYSPKEAQNSGRVTQTWTSFGRRIPGLYPEEQVKLMAGPGGIISNVEDMSKWVHTVLNGGVDPRSNFTVVPPSAFEKITTAHSVMIGGPTSHLYGFLGYGLGWMRSTSAGHDMLHHSGSLHGFSAFVVAALADGIGIVVLANADGKHLAIEAVSHLVARAILGGDDLGLPSHMLSSDALEPQKSQRPQECTDMPPFDFTGTYHNDGYGTMTLCNLSSTSNFCSGVLTDFANFRGASPCDQAHALYAVFPRTRTTHIRFVHVENTRFDMEPTYLFPDGYGRNTTPFEVIITEAQATFVVEHAEIVGFGLSGTVFEGPTMREKEGGPIEYTAEAWFAKT